MPASLTPRRSLTLALLDPAQVKGRLRATNTLLGLLWLSGPAATTHAEALLTALLKAVEDEDDDVRRQVRCSVALAGAGCDVAVYLPLVLKQVCRCTAPPPARRQQLRPSAPPTLAPHSSTPRPSDVRHAHHNRRALPPRPP